MKLNMMQSKDEILERSGIVGVDDFQSNVLKEDEDNEMKILKTSQQALSCA